MIRARVRVVLVGAGHAHLLVLRHAGALRAAGVEPILVAPPTFHYSGLATAVLSGALPPGRALLDVGALAARYGVRHLPAEVAAIDRQARRLHLSDGQDLAYDAVSFNIGSVTAYGGDLQGEGEAWPVKPLSGLAGLRRRLEDHLADGVSPSIVVAGGGPTGFEIAAALAGRVERAGLSPRVLILRRSMPDWACPRMPPRRWNWATTRCCSTRQLPKRAIPSRWRAPLRSVSKPVVLPILRARWSRATWPCRRRR